MKGQLLKAVAAAVYSCVRNAWPDSFLLWTFLDLENPGHPEEQIRRITTSIRSLVWSGRCSPCLICCGSLESRILQIQSSGGLLVKYVGRLILQVDDPEMLLVRFGVAFHSKFLHVNSSIMVLEKFNNVAILAGLLDCDARGLWTKKGAANCRAKLSVRIRIYLGFPAKASFNFGTNLAATHTSKLMRLRRRNHERPVPFGAQGLGLHQRSSSAFRFRAQIFTPNDIRQGAAVTKRGFRII